MLKVKNKEVANNEFVCSAGNIAGNSKCSIDKDSEGQNLQVCL